METQALRKIIYFLIADIKKDYINVYSQEWDGWIYDL